MREDDPVIEIRAYQPADRDGVALVCLRTAAGGGDAKFAGERADVDELS